MRKVESPERLLLRIHMSWFWITFLLRTDSDFRESVYKENMQKVESPERLLFGSLPSFSLTPIFVNLCIKKICKKWSHRKDCFLHILCACERVSPLACLLPEAKCVDPKCLSWCASSLRLVCQCQAGLSVPLVCACLPSVCQVSAKCLPSLRASLRVSV